MPPQEAMMETYQRTAQIPCTRAGSRMTVGSLRKAGDVLHNQRELGRSEEVKSGLLTTLVVGERKAQKQSKTNKLDKGKYVPRREATEQMQSQNASKGKQTCGPITVSGGGAESRRTLLSPVGRTRRYEEDGSGETATCVSGPARRVLASDRKKPQAPAGSYWSSGSQRRQPSG
ncbi:Hypothetical predicted protein [Pelobates cultripes]|uniref:Uncharacterized protein n=1 Tax=Pelobates cultripes TaxID=61616 RepID=A0AAD1S7A1_PELCU|nr:Hypothetical predicted protein [Pelobates cultripes]